MKLTKTGLTLALVLIMSACAKESKIELATVKVEKGNLTETVTATGTVESVTQVDVGTQVTGIIDKLYADFNSIVKKGELIAEIEKTVLESDYKSAEASVASAKYTYEYNRTNYERNKKLHDKQLISDYEFDTSQKEYEVSKAAYDKAVADRVRAAKNLNYAEIYSPIDGIVISREVEVGQTVVSSMNVANLYTIADLDNMQIVGNVDEADIGEVKVGQKVKFSVDAYPNDTFEGTVTQVRLSPTTESNVVTYEVIVGTSNPDHKLIPGLTANLTIYTMSEDDILLLPPAAFTFEPEDHPDMNLPEPGKAIDKSSLSEDERTVWVVEGNSLVNKLVKIGVTNGIKTSVVSGLKDGDVVAVGYESGKEMAEQQGDGSSDKQSPFAPQPPGRNKKK